MGNSLQMSSGKRALRVVGKTGRFLAKAVLIIWCVFSVYSLLWVLISSLKTDREFFENAWGIPGTWEIANYISAWTDHNLNVNFLNSVIVVSGAVVLILVLATPAAYVLAKIRFPFSGAITGYIILGMGVPVQLIIIPLYFIMNQAKLIDTFPGLILVYTAISLSFTVFLEMGFFKSLPSSLAEAAAIDGCSSIGIFFRIMLPLGRPGVVTSAIFNFISLWNEFMIALIFLPTSKNFTLPVGIYTLATSMQYTGRWTTLMAGLVIVLIPTLIIYMLLSRQIIEGLTMGAVKE